MSDIPLVRNGIICLKYQHVVLRMVVSSWNPQRVKRMTGLSESISTAA